MERLPPLSFHERQLEDLRYSPDDFDQSAELTPLQFHETFSQCINDYIVALRREGVKVPISLSKEAELSRGDSSRLYKVLESTHGRALTWGDFAVFLREWERDWDQELFTFDQPS